jgi:two-component system sensor histidine kinase/response regulator
MAIFSSKNLSSKQSEPEVKQHTILLVDDEKGNLHVMSSLLRKSCNVLTALNGRLALQVIQEMGDKELSMIITDQRMPEMTGVELLEETVITHPNTLRLIVSGYSDISAILVAINKAKIYHFITKPFEPADFLATVHEGLKTYDLKKKMTDQFERMQEKLTMYEEKRDLKDVQLEKALNKLKAMGSDIDC